MRDAHKTNAMGRLVSMFKSLEKIVTTVCERFKAVRKVHEHSLNI